MWNTIGFLDPEGIVYECFSYEHLDLAKKLCESKFNEKFPNRLDAENHLLNKGWIAIRARDIYGRIGFRISPGSEQRIHLTKEQKDWLNSNYEKMPQHLRRYVDEIFDWDN